MRLSRNQPAHLNSLFIRLHSRQDNWYELPQAAREREDPHREHLYAIPPDSPMTLR